ncbi:IS630-like element ISAli3 family transposase [Azospirillum lipoferum]|uniref:IS630-like element ISAli3 family transposase n=1 Tax=Azospirillum lipoferum TaxID=193 RepID=UPI000A2F46BE|nr:IS630-like element ISAli3 family transposase [Azospirillum lipoferum]
MAAIAITRLELSSAELRQRAVRFGDPDVARRLLALALVLEGRSREDAARSCGMDRQTLRDWVHRYNAQGVAGLRDRKAPGAKPKLSAEQEAEVASWVRSGPDLAEDGVVRWRRCDLARKIERRFGVVLAERSVGGLLRRLGFRRLSVRPQHPQQDGEALEAHKKNFAALVAGALPDTARGKPLELWWQDEARVGQQGTLTRVWAAKGSRPRAPRDQRHSWAYLFGAVCPSRGAAAALVLPKANAAAMTLHLAEISGQVSDHHAVLILDGAGWHQPGDKLVVPENISLLHLPPYCPELNPVENIWQFLRQNHLSHRVFDSYAAIVEACCEAWNALAQAPEIIRSIASRSWAAVNV